MTTYLFRRSISGLIGSVDGLAGAVRAAMQEISEQGTVAMRDSSAIETPDSDGGYVLLSIAGEIGWHYHQEAVFRRHGITCALYPSA